MLPREQDKITILVKKDGQTSLTSWIFPSIRFFCLLLFSTRFFLKRKTQNLFWFPSGGSSPFTGTFYQAMSLRGILCFSMVKSSYMSSLSLLARCVSKTDGHISQKGGGTK